MRNTLTTMPVTWTSFFRARAIYVIKWTMVHGVYLVSQKLPKMIPKLLHLPTSVFDELAEEGVNTDVNTEGRDGDGFVLLIVISAY